jgi:hypothetical protein
VSSIQTIKEENVGDLARKLYHLVLERPIHLSKKQHDQHLARDKSRHALVLCCVIERLLEPSAWDEENDRLDNVLIENLVASLPFVILLAMHAPGSSTFRYQAICCTVKLMGRVVHADCAGAFVDALLPLFSSKLDMTYDILVFVAGSIVDFLQYDENSALRIDSRKVTRIVSVLSTAAMLGQCPDFIFLLKKMLSLPGIALHIMSLPCILSPVSHTLKTGSVGRKALAFTLAIDIVLTSPTLMHRNFNELMKAIAWAAEKETNEQRQQIKIRAILKILKAASMTAEQEEVLRSSLAEISLGSTPSCATDAAAMAFMSSLDKNGSQTSWILAIVTKMMRSRCAKVRKMALEFLNHVSFWRPGTAMVLVEETEISQRLCSIFTSDSSEGIRLALSICQHLVFDHRTHQLLCEHEGFADALVTLLGSESKSVLASAAVIDVVLQLLESSCAFYFQPLRSCLLPLLVRTANRTTEQKIKTRIVAVIVRFSSMILEEK